MAEQPELSLEAEPEISLDDGATALPELDVGDSLESLTETDESRQLEAEDKLEKEADSDGLTELTAAPGQEMMSDPPSAMESQPASDPQPTLEINSEPAVEPLMQPDAEPVMATDLATSPPTGASIQTADPGPAVREPLSEMASAPDIIDALAQVVGAVERLLQAVPQWATLVFAVFMAAIIGLLVGWRISRRGGAKPQAPATETPTVRAALPAPENPAFKNYQVFLETKGVSAKERDAQMRAFSERYREMRQNLRDLIPGNKELAEQVELVRDALDAGDFDRTYVLLTRIGNKENADGLEKRTAALKHLMAAAIAKSVAGDLQMSRLDYESAADNFRQAVEALPPFQEDLHAEYLNKYGTASYQAGHHETAIAAFERALQILEKRLGKNHPDVATALNNLALLHYSRGNYDAAEPLYKRSLTIDEQTLGIDHAGVATDLNNLALLYKKKGNLEEAEPLLRRAMEIKEKNFDPGHPSLVTGLRNYASLLRSLGREEEADVYERRATVLPPSRTGIAAE